MQTWCAVSRLRHEEVEREQGLTRKLRLVMHELRRRLLRSNSGPTRPNLHLITRLHLHSGALRLSIRHGNGVASECLLGSLSTDLFVLACAVLGELIFFGGQLLFVLWVHSS